MAARSLSGWTRRQQHLEHSMDSRDRKSTRLNSSHAHISPLSLPTLFRSNTIDNSKPLSRVLALTATQSSVHFPVQWSGTDTGSGIGKYTIFVSENGGPFTIWLDKTTATSGTFDGQPRSEEHTSELQSRPYLSSFPTDALPI